jgi:hypothetical protein
MTPFLFTQLYGLDPFICEFHWFICGLKKQQFFKKLCFYCISANSDDFFYFSSISSIDNILTISTKKGALRLPCSKSMHRIHCCMFDYNTADEERHDETD